LHTSSVRSWAFSAPSEALTCMGIYGAYKLLIYQSWIITKTIRFAFSTWGNRFRCQAYKIQKDCGLDRGPNWEWHDIQEIFLTWASSANNSESKFLHKANHVQVYRCWQRLNLVQLIIIMGYGGWHFLTLKTFHLKWGTKTNSVSYEPIMTDVDYVDTDCKLLKATNALQTCCTST
jgi:hypothetical protein